jgi:hypothetical protein
MAPPLATASVFGFAADFTWLIPLVVTPSYNCLFFLIYLSCASIDRGHHRQRALGRIFVLLIS